ncbi:Apolipoprotein L6 [Liparis tanakae]|uniref:Apolipoprotein L6 n=1 Tax=Liparis tanakae TaxID=230148 RepID=A0A4Z2I4D6_9TELE|nr:Apolipoprotein L6 [Liparis tanakae]
MDSSRQDLDHPVEYSPSGPDAGGEAACEITPRTKASRSGVMEVMHKVNPFKSTPQTPGLLRGVMQKVNPFKSSSPAPPTCALGKAASAESLEPGGDAPRSPGVLRGVMQKVNPFKSTAQVSKAASSESLEAGLDSGQNPGKVKGAMQKMNPFKSPAQAPRIQIDSPDTPETTEQDAKLLHSDLSSSSGSLTDGKEVPEKCSPGMFRGMMQKVNPFRSPAQKPDEECEVDSAAPGPSSLTQTVWYAEAGAGHEAESRPKKRTATFRIRRILPAALFGSGTKDSSSDTQAPPQEVVEVQTLEMVAVPEHMEGTVLDLLDEEEGLLGWWRTVDGWDQWNEDKHDDEPEDVVEQAADRVFMAARLFVRFFNQRGATLQQHILELMSLADAADAFHKKTVKASVGGGVASVAGSVTTITGLILAPFTMGASLIVTAVGIGVATAGSVASASANITDTVHSKTDRKKVEKIIHEYEDEMKDIRECLEFLQEGMEMLEEWNFEQYAENISKKHLNQNVKHVMKEGGRAGKALVVNTESLISTVQVLSVAGGAAKAAQMMSITTGVMSGLFLALDVFFLAKDAKELKQGAKTEFAGKIREVCKDLQDGLLELNRVKEQLQKTIDGIEVEVDEEEEEDEELLKSELKKLVDFDE